MSIIVNFVTDIELFLWYYKYTDDNIYIWRKCSDKWGTYMREYTNICPYDCPDACGLVVTVDNNKVIKKKIKK